MPEAATSMHLEPAFIPHHGAATPLLDQSELHGRSIANVNTSPLQVPCHLGMHCSLECWRQRRARTLSPPLPRTMKNTHFCSISRSSMAAPLQRQNHNHAGAWSWRPAHSTCVFTRQRRARTLRPPQSRTMEQPQACSISRSFMAASLQWQTNMPVPDRASKDCSSECQR